MKYYNFTNLSKPLNRIQLPSYFCILGYLKSYYYFVHTVRTFQILLVLCMGETCIYSGGKKYLVSHQLCKFSHLKR
ncbi:hypothetical protein J4Q44_G00051730 [Coregonus suidteri]|uniref:Uncharacterized protein n=1 Tax=Coregonus suidteri TaxID=861788 RepID=A0AAN8NEJ7_9TELE